MSYHQRYRRRALGADTSHGPSWYRAMGGVSSQPPGPRIARHVPSLGSLGADDPATNTTTLSTPTLTDPTTAAWQQNVLAQLQAGVATLRKAELQKWLQIAATVLIPVSAAVWKAIFKSGKTLSETGI